ncbi:MAG TPA: host-nuclease inhibitor Gam family protein [Burkholderiales bacterium]|nr:host-nuclease inhibitor Gam family protein [Burkholderiales bacterium]
MTTATITLTDIETATRRYADARAKLAERVTELEDEVRALKRARLPAIRRALAEAQARRDELQALVADAPELFERPKTVIFHGIRVGYQKGRGSITWEDDAKVCALIRRHFPDQADQLIKVIERPLKTALAQLSTADLKRLGVQVVETGEEIVIRPVDGELDRMIERLLDQGEDGNEVD